MPRDWELRSPRGLLRVWKILRSWEALGTADPKKKLNIPGDLERARSWIPIGS